MLELVSSDNMADWPREEDGDVLECLHFYNARNLTLTSSGSGILDGQVSCRGFGECGCW